MDTLSVRYCSHPDGHAPKDCLDKLIADAPRLAEEKVEAALNAVKALADAIRELGMVPSGHLYASIMGSVSLENYTATITILKNANLVAEDGAHMLRWIGPYPLAPTGMRS